MSFNKFNKVEIILRDANEPILRKLFAKEGDYNGRELQVKIIDGGAVKDLSNLSLRLYWKHLNMKNQGIEPFDATDASKGVFEVTYPNNMMNEGNVLVWIQIYNNDTLIGTPNTIIEVEGSGFDAVAAVASDDYKALNDALLRVEHIEGNEQDRQETFETNETSRENTFESNEDTRQSNENTRISNENTRKSNEIDREQAESQRQSDYQQAESDRTSDYEQAENNRDSQYQTAENARESEFEQRANAMEEQYPERLNNIEEELRAPIMGVEWDKSSNPTMTRIGISEGLIANIGIGNERVRNDFDNMPIYREIIREVDNLGNVFVRIPKFYIRKTIASDFYRLEISKEKLSGFYLPYLFWDFDKNQELNYAYYGAHEASLSSDDQRLESKPGVQPLASNNIVQFRDFARANGKGYQQNDVHAIDVLRALFHVEFATLHSQSIHPGFTSGNSEPGIAGTTDDVVASSGAVGTGGSDPFMYRGIENPWGSVYEWVDGINVNNHQAWVAKNAEDYTSNVFTSPYEQLGYVNHNSNTWVTEMGYDDTLPFAEFPVAGGGSTNTYYADHYYQNSGQRVARFGGYWSTGSAAGLSLWNLSAGSARANSYVGGRLLKKPL